jgi:aminoglycoside 2'-N-acetyltransferase I
MDLRLARSDELTPAELERIREVCDRAFAQVDRLEAFTDDDMAHALGGVHAIGVEDGRIVAHGAVVERELHAAGRSLRTGYLEGVAVVPELQRRRLGTAIVSALDEEVLRSFELGALDTSTFAFYERLGWERWRGPTFVRVDGRDERTPEEDGFVMVLRTPRTPLDLDLDASLSCEWRPGDVW